MSLCKLCALFRTSACKSRIKRECFAVEDGVVAVPTTVWECCHIMHDRIHYEEPSCPIAGTNEINSASAKENREATGCFRCKLNADGSKTGDCKYAVKFVVATAVEKKPYADESCPDFVMRFIDDILETPNEWRGMVGDTLREQVLSFTEDGMQRKRKTCFGECIEPLDSLGISIGVPSSGKKRRFIMGGNTVAKNGAELIKQLKAWENARLRGDPSPLSDFP